MSPLEATMRAEGDRRFAELLDRLERLAGAQAATIPE
jgi:hypothetical protein